MSSDSIQPSEAKAVEIIGRSPSVLALLSVVEKVAPTTATVLIQGESGTGKELIAKLLHQKSPRAKNAYVTVNCGALQESLLESELFGHERGSFTGAVQQKMGLCEIAHEGTLFLDEIGEMAPAIQAKLLRFLQEGEFYRIGGKRPISVSVRIISASNKDLEKCILEAQFREDLFYRLNTITLRMPPLRKRQEDIPLLVDHFLNDPRILANGKSPKIPSSESMKILVNYSWPGNIRELQNTMERLNILVEGPVIQPDDLPSNVRRTHSPSDSSLYQVDMPLHAVEKNHILRALDYYRGNKTKTAQVLGITIKTLYNKLHRYGLIGKTETLENLQHSITQNPLSEGEHPK